MGSPTRLAALLACACVGLASPAFAQAGGEELLHDPELDGPTPTPTPPATVDDGDPGERIDDPELAGATTPETTSVPSLAPIASPAADPDGQARIVLHSRVGVDTAWQDAREDVIEATQMALFELRVRRSESLGFAVGLRGRHVFATRDDDTLDAAAARTELDATPTAAYADVGLGGGLHLRAGWQTSHLGRFDVLSASNVLGVYDLRSGPSTLPEASDVAQPALRLDWDIGDSSALRIHYLPFFQPHLVHLSEGDYALLPSRQAEIDAALGLAADPEGAAARGRLLRRSLSRSGQARLARSGLSAFAPDPNLGEPQAALRLSTRGAGMEGAFTAATALERLPVLELDDALVAALVDPSADNLDALAATAEPIAVRYGRFGVVAIDGALDVGPVQLGTELALQLGRTLFAAEAGQVPIGEKADLAHLGLRMEYVRGEAWVLAIEAMGQHALAEPEADGRAFMFFSDERLMLAAVGFLGFAPPGVGMKLELAGGVLNGPSYLLLPRAEFELAGALFAELGALLMGGERPGMPGDPAVALGGLYADVDQVYVGLRWLP